MHARITTNSMTVLTLSVIGATRNETCRYQCTELVVIRARMSDLQCHMVDYFHMLEVNYSIAGCNVQTFYASIIITGPDLIRTMVYIYIYISHTLVLTLAMLTYFHMKVVGGRYDCYKY